MAERRPKRDRVSVSVYADVDVDDILGEAGDDQIKAEYASRFGSSAVGLPSFDLVDEIRAELVGGRVNAAIALCDGHITAARVTDIQRQRQYQEAGRAH